MAPGPERVSCGPSAGGRGSVPGEDRSGKVPGEGSRRRTGLWRRTAEKEMVEERAGAGRRRAGGLAQK